MLVQMRYCSIDQALLLILPFYELGSLDAILYECANPTARRETVLMAWHPLWHWNAGGVLKRIAADVAWGMEFLAERDIMHRDLKVRCARCVTTARM